MQTPRLEPAETHSGLSFPITRFSVFSPIFTTIYEAYENTVDFGSIAIMDVSVLANGVVLILCKHYQDSHLAVQPCF